MRSLRHLLKELKVVKIVFLGHILALPGQTFFEVFVHALGVDVLLIYAVSILVR